MDSYMVYCQDRKGRQHSSTFEVEKNQTALVLRIGWREAIRLCGHIEAVRTAFVATIEGITIGTLR